MFNYVEFECKIKKKKFDNLRNIYIYIIYGM